MADNTVLDPGAGGDTVATDDIGGVKHQRVKIQHGPDGAADDVSGASPLPSRGLLWNGSAWVNLPNAAIDGHTADWVPVVQGGLYNGTTVDRARGVIGDAQPPMGLAAQHPMGYDAVADQYHRLRTAAEDAGGANVALKVVPALYNGATVDRARSPNAVYTGRSVQGLAAEVPHAMQSTGNVGPIAAAEGVADGNSGLNVQATHDLLYNGAGFDRERGNLPAGVAIASAARTATVVSAELTNHNARGIHVKLDVSSAGTGSLTVELIPNGFGMAQVAALTGHSSIMFYPGVESGQLENGHARSIAVPRSFYLSVTPTDASSWTYSLAYALIV